MNELKVGCLYTSKENPKVLFVFLGSHEAYIIRNAYGKNSYVIVALFDTSQFVEAK